MSSVITLTTRTFSFCHTTKKTLLKITIARAFSVENANHASNFFAGIITTGTEVFAGAKF